MPDRVETEYRLETQAFATISAAGTGNKTGIGPVRPGERWEIHFLGASGAHTCRLQVMRGDGFNPSRQLDITDRADGDSSETNIVLQTNETISFWWTGGTTGDVMTCSISGSYFVAGRRAY